LRAIAPENSVNDRWVSKVATYTAAITISVVVGDGTIYDYRIAMFAAPYTPARRRMACVVCCIVGYETIPYDRITFTGYATTGRAIAIVASDSAESYFGTGPANYPTTGVLLDYTSADFCAALVTFYSGTAV